MSDHTFSKYRPHPWHGIDVGEGAPQVVTAYIEMTPFDTVKYEVDKVSGYLIVDRPQKFSSQLPCLYGYIPKTYCGEHVNALSPVATHGDGDPLDICVLSSVPIDKSQILLDAKIVGGLQMVDGGEADDKIIAVLKGDIAWGDVEDISELPEGMINKIHHYFLSYKNLPGEPALTSIEEVYGFDHAVAVLEASQADYKTLVDGWT